MSGALGCRTVRRPTAHCVHRDRPEFAANSRILREVALKAVDAITGGDEMEIAKTRVELGRQVSALLALCVDGGHLS